MNEIEAFLHGYEQDVVGPVGDIEVVNKMGVDLVSQCATDQMVIAAARVSTKGVLSAAEIDNDPEESKGLIRYLMENRHTSPFEHNLFTFLVDAPIKVFREQHRHRIGFAYNEASGRYSKMAPRFYVAPSTRKMVQEGKPGAYRFVDASPEQVALYQATLINNFRGDWADYQRLLGAGLAKEVSRDVLPLNLMSQCWVTCNARSMMAFLSLRTERQSPVTYRQGKPEFDWGQIPLDEEWAWNRSTPMREIADVADMYEAALREHMPITYQAFVDFGRSA